MIKFSGVFKQIESTIVVNGNFETIRKRLESQTEFLEKLPNHWEMARKEKPFAGIIQGSGFIVMQKAISGTRFGTLVSGRYFETLANEGSVQLKAWINLRARGKIIFGYLLAVGLIATLVHDYYVNGAISDFNRVLPFALLAVVPMNMLATVAYVKARNKALETIQEIISTENP